MVKKVINTVFIRGVLKWYAGPYLTYMIGDFFRKIVNGEESLCNFAKKLDHGFLTGS